MLSLVIVLCLKYYDWYENDVWYVWGLLRPEKNAKNSGSGHCQREAPGGREVFARRSRTRFRLVMVCKVSTQL